MNKNIFSPKLILSCALLQVGLIYVNAVCVKATGQRQQLRSPIIPINASVPSLKDDTLKQTVLKLLRGRDGDKFIYRNREGKLEVRLNRNYTKDFGLITKPKSVIYEHTDGAGNYVEHSSGSKLLYISSDFKITNKKIGNPSREEIIFQPKGNTVEIFERMVLNSSDVFKFENPDIITNNKFTVYFHDDEGNPTDAVFKITHENKMVGDVEASSSQIARKTIEEFRKNYMEIYNSYFEESKEDGSMVTRQWYFKNSLEGTGYEMTEVRTDGYGNISGARYGVDGQLIKNIPPSLNVRDIDFNKFKSELTHQERR